jgi:hypothetical protein
MGRLGRGGGCGYGRGMGYGRGYWSGAAPGGASWRGMGMGNPYPHCRFYPWMPRRWSAMGMSSYGPGAPSNPQGGSVPSRLSRV